ncbi:protein STPG3 [Varanus komodoensis]|uniref:protein STPG3 n=1 Tax=Varanus komodoensis TaxID=61221 RepID=UPI001CF7EBB0|nr:protein STPG3 [Varanus komodoensis]
MESQQKHIKFMAQLYLDRSQKWGSKTPFCSKRGLQSREKSAPPLFPEIYSGRQSRSQAKPEGRLQLTVNIDSPGPAAYGPPNLTCRETGAPSYTFGWKTPPRDGGGCRAWQKSWFLSKNPFIRKVDFAHETNWPSPFHYGQPLGSQLVNRPNSPNFTIGHKGEFSFVNKETLNDPAPNKYDTERAYKYVLQKSPSYIISPVPLKGHRWAHKGGTPGPGTYNVARAHNARLPSSPSFYIQGVRRPKKHETGPFSTV